MKYKQLALVALVASSLAIPVWAASNGGNIAITADELTYDGQTGKASANGAVVITKDDKTMTGASGWYNTKTEEAYLTGGVSLIGTNMSMAASEVHSYNNNQINATGNVHLQKDDRQIYGDDVTYNTSTDYGTVKGNGKLIVDDNVLTGNYIEAWVNQINAKATGNVTLHSARRNLDATANEATYHQTPNQNDGVVFLKGNAHAVQSGNVLNAPELRIQLDNNSAETLGGRSTLIITPNK